MCVICLLLEIHTSPWVHCILSRICSKCVYAMKYIFICAAYHMLELLIMFYIFKILQDVEFRDLFGVVAHDYEATIDTEVSLKEGQRIRVISEEENGWRQAMIPDPTNEDVMQYGWFPSTYVWKIWHLSLSFLTMISVSTWLHPIYIVSLLVYRKM